MSALETAFHEFNFSILGCNDYRGYRLLACDGSDLNFTRNPNDDENCYNPGHSAKSFNLMHLNALYDLCNRRYADALIQSGHEKDEFRALCCMVDRYHNDTDAKTIFIADRGFSSYNVFAHVIEKGEYFLIRSKDRDRKGILVTFPYLIQKSLTCPLVSCQQTKKTKAHPEICRFVSKDMSFDFAEYGSDSEYL